MSDSSSSPLNKIPSSHCSSSSSSAVGKQSVCKCGSKSIMATSWTNKSKKKIPRLSSLLGMKNLELKAKLKEYDAMERKVKQLEGMESKLKEDKQKMKLQLQEHVKWKKFWKSTTAILAGDRMSLLCVANWFM